MTWPDVTYTYSSIYRLGSSISYDKQTGKVRYIDCNYDKEDKDTIVIKSFRDKLYALFKKDKETWDEENIFLMKAVSDYLPLTMEKLKEILNLENESIDLFHYAFIVPSEWEEEIRDDIIRPIFVKSGLISNEDHQDRLLFFSDIESMFYRYPFERGNNTILCRITPDEGKADIKFDLIQTSSTLYNFPNANLFPKVMESSSVPAITDDIDGRIAKFLRTNLFYVATDDDRDEENMKRYTETRPWIIRSLNYIVTTITPTESDIEPPFLLAGAGISVFEAIQHSDMYYISLGSTLLTYLLLNEDGLAQQIFDYNYLIANNLPPLGCFYTFLNAITLNVKEQFIPFAERYLLGDLADFTADDGVSIKKDQLFEMKAILTKELSSGEALISTNKPKYINAFVLMYMIYIKEEILNKLPDHLISDHTDTKIGYAISIEAMLLNNTIGTKDSLQDIIFSSGLVLKVDDYKKLRITTQGEKIFPAIQKSLKLELSLKSYFLVCQLHEDYVQLTLHQVVTAPSSEEEEQESIIVQDEILDIPNIYDSLYTSMWNSLVQDSSLIELCEMHITSDDNKILDLFSSKTKTELFANLKKEEADDFNLELGIDTFCLLVPELLSQLLQPVISQRPLCYKYFEIGVLQQVRSEN
ncbi:hypothetical protein HPULCUR_009686 [Helicostylum pulchrum]|uniref:Uncharacterized protein n=1 Tax=Helicostylum pulchrum TaxID=562976 RepID=A0ABP9YB68_9FUNG